MLSIEDLKSDGTNDPGDNNASAEPASETVRTGEKVTNRLTRTRKKSGTTGNLASTKTQDKGGSGSSEKLQSAPTKAAADEESDPFTLIKANFNLEGLMTKKPSVDVKPANKQVIPSAAEKGSSLVIRDSSAPAKETKPKAEPAGKAAQSTSLAASPVTSPKLSRTGQPRYNQRRLDFQFHRIIQQLDIKPSLETPLVIGVTSTLRGEGRTTVALGLAAALAQELPLPVVLLESDLERPSLAEDLRLANRGLSEYLSDELELDDLAQSTDLPGLRVIVAGDCQVPPLKVLRSERFDGLIKILSQQSAVVVVDLPPMATTGEAARVIGQLDRVLMVVEAGSTPAKLVKSALELIPEEKLVGVLLNRTKPAFGFLHWLKGLFR